MDGVLNVNKPAGPTSHDIVARVRRILKEKRVGHTGTLDPLATGVLVICVGKATRIVEYLVGQEKEYVARIVLGRTTTTEDGSGEVLTTSDASHITSQMILDVLPQFTGAIMQVPPMVSAVKYQGERLYKLARKDIQVEREAREVTIHELEMTGFDPEGPPHGLPAAGLRVVCSSGTYIRTLCADIGAALGVGGYMDSLLRTRVGGFVIDQARNLDTLEQIAEQDRLDEALLPMDKALSAFPSAVTDDIHSRLILHGGTIPSQAKAPDGSLVRVKSEAGELLAVGRLHLRAGGSVIVPEKVFAEASG